MQTADKRDIKSGEWRKTNTEREEGSGLVLTSGNDGMIKTDKRTGRQVGRWRDRRSEEWKGM